MSRDPFSTLGGPMSRFSQKQRIGKYKFLLWVKVPLSVKIQLLPVFSSATEKSIFYPLPEDLLDRKLPNLSKGICGEYSHWIDRWDPMIIVKWNYSVLFLNRPISLSVAPCGTELMSQAGNKWSDSIFSLGNVTLMDTSNFFQPEMHGLSSRVHLQLLNITLTGSPLGTKCARNNKLKFH